MPVFEQVSYKGWPTCYRLANETVELVITADVGPRIIRFGFVGGENMFANYPHHMGRTGGDDWRLYGGHRLWHAPEAPPRTTQPDNSPITVTGKDDHVHVCQPTETNTGIQKELEIALVEDARARVVHRLTNHGLWAVELAPWALSVMDTGGTAIIPLPPRGTHAQNRLPTNTLTLWAYTDMADPRWTWGQQFVLLRQDASLPAPQKIGAMVPDGWAAYANKNTLFLKTFDYEDGASYPDMGCNVETYTCPDMLELESLGPLVVLEPGQSVEHVEFWNLFADVPRPESDADVATHILPLVAQVRR